MIVSSLRNLFMCTIAGFFFNLPLMGTIVIVYEKVRGDWSIGSIFRSSDDVNDLYVVRPWHTGVFKVHVADHSVIVSPVVRDSDDALFAGCRSARQGMSGLAPWLGWIPASSHHSEYLHARHSCQLDALHRTVWSQWWHRRKALCDAVLHPAARAFIALAP